MDLMHHFENLTYGTLWAIWSILVMSSYRSPGSIYSTGFSCHWEASMIRSCRSFFAWRGGPYYTDFRPPLAIADFQLQTNNLTTWSGFKESLEAAGEALRQLDGVGQVVILLHSPGATADGQPKGPQNQRFTAAPAACRDDSKPNSWRKCRVGCATAKPNPPCETITPMKAGWGTAHETLLSRLSVVPPSNLLHGLKDHLRGWTDALLDWATALVICFSCFEWFEWF